jgi:NodT family efflux transporter outer membrane factor (OMF) lipoprotein
LVIFSVSAAGWPKILIVAQIPSMRRINEMVNLSNTKHGRCAIAIACSFLLVLPSCIPHLRDPVPGPILPESFRGATSPDNSSQVTIEDFFNDPMLTGLIHQALLGNQELRILAEEVQIASNEILARQGAYLPFISPVGSMGTNRYSAFTPAGAGIRDDPFRPGRFFPNPVPDFMFGTLLTWTPDIYWQLHNAKDAAAMRYFAAGEGRAYVATSVVAEIADDYYQLMALDKRLENLDSIIALQQQSLRFAQLAKEFARNTDLPVQRFQAEVRKNQSEKFVVYQDIIQVENRINFLAGRFPQPVARVPLKLLEDYIDLNLHTLSVGVPAELLRNRPDVRQAERELAAAGLDVKVARKQFYPHGLLTAGVGYESFNPSYLVVTPEALAAQVAGNLLVPFINRKAIKADYFSANARQLQAVYKYQRVVLNAFTEVVNRLTKVQNYLNSIEIKKQQVKALESAVDRAMTLYQFAHPDVDYLDVLLAQNALFEARLVLIATKREQLSAVVNTYQALGGGAYLSPIPKPEVMQPHLQHHRWKHLWHSHASGAPEPGPGPLPPPVPTPEGPPGPPPTPAAAGPPEPPPTPAAAGPPGLPPTPAAERGPGPLPTPAPGTSLEPLPTPRERGNGSGTGSSTNNPPR